MGIVYTTLAPTAVRLAYICQKLFDPKYSCIEDVQTTSSSASPEVSSSAAAAAAAADSLAAQQQVQSTLSAKVELMSSSQALTQESSLLPSRIQSRILSVKSNSLPRYNAKSPEYNLYSLHQQNRNRRARQIRFKTRPSSFDGALVIRTKTKNAVIVTSTPSPLARHWDVTSSSGCSSDSISNSESDSETELRVSTNASNEKIGASSSSSSSSSPKLAMTAEDEEDFRLTLGRGHFTRSKKDRFLNNLRLQKQSIYHPAASTFW